MFENIEAAFKKLAAKRPGSLLDCASTHEIYISWGNDYHILLYWGWYICNIEFCWLSYVKRTLTN